MKNVEDPGVQVLCCQSVTLDGWGTPGMSFRAPHWRIYWNRERGAAVLFKGRLIELTPARVFLIPPETDFSPVLRTAVRHFFIHFSAGPPYDRCEPGIYGAEADASTTRRFQDIVAMGSEGRSEVEPRLTALVMASVYDALAALPGEAIRRLAADERVERALAAIRANVERPPSNETLAGLAHMSISAFVSRFRRIVGESPQQYSRRKRIERACVLLHFSEASIDEIAEKTGFCDRYHFTRVFRSQRGMGPGAFRRTGNAARNRGTRNAEPSENFAGN